jgi:hypothetical protein
MRAAPPVYQVRQKSVDIIYTPDNSSANAFKASIETMSTLSASTGIRYKLLPGSYEISNTITLAAGHNISFEGSVFTRTSISGQIRCQGSVGTLTQALTTDISNQNRPQSSTNTPSLLTKAFIASTTGFVAGDWIMVWSNDTVSVSSTDGVPGKRGSLRKILTVDVSGLTIKPLWWIALVSQGASVTKFNMIKGGTIIGGEFLDTPSVRSTANLAAFFKFAYCLNQQCSGQYIHDLGGKAQDYIHCIKPTASNQRITDLPDSDVANQYGYGCAFSGGTTQGYFKDSVVERVRHAFTTDRPFVGDSFDTIGQPEHCFCTNNRIAECTNTSIDCHKEGWITHIEGNHVRDGLAIGISTRAPRTVIRNNVVTNCYLYGILVTNWANNSLVESNTASHTIRDAVGAVGGYGIQTAASQSVIRNNDGFSNQLADILVAAGQNQNIVSFNRVRSDGGITIAANATNTVLQGNVGIQTSAGVFIEELAGCSGTVLQGNINTGAGTYSLLGNAATRSLQNNSGLPDILPAYTTATRPTAATYVSGRIFNTTTSQIEVSNGQAWLTGSNQEVVNQTAHGLAVGDIVRATASGYVKAQANSAANCKGLCGIVATLIDANTFVLQDSGLTGIGFVSGAEYWLSTSVAGGVQQTAPTTTGQVQLPVGIGVLSGRFRILIQSGTVNP